ncbi:hypothetical protein IKQ74_01925 [Candidatus Saccharibacteria bacterium]|nr:hypothetical protein [Candidatus Saccharibacteria bacterium]
MDKEEYTFNTKIDGKDCTVTLSIAELAELMGSVQRYRQLQESEKFEKNMNRLRREAAAIAVEKDAISTSLLQRRLHIGYGRAAELIEELAEMGVVSNKGNGNHGRDVLIASMDEYPKQYPRQNWKN